VSPAECIDRPDAGRIANIVGTVTRRLAFARWETHDDWRAGTGRGTAIAGAGLEIRRPLGTRTDERATSEYAAWTSPWVEPGFAVEELVASWAATTPRGSLVEIHVRGRDRPWDCLGRWTSAGGGGRSSVSGQPRVDADTWRPAGAPAWQLRLTLVRRPGTHGPTVHMAGAVASAGRTGTTTSRPGRTVGTVLDVPRLSQMTFRDVGGRGWCSPTSVAMVLDHGGRLPRAIDVPAAARATFDQAYDGTGNWSFNTAWAATLADHAFVTRLHDLREAEAFIDAGIPLVASVAYGRGELRGAPTHATDGHLVVIRGFTGTGDVVTNDPGAPTDRSVRRTYRRAEFERAWLGGSGGTVYVIHDDDHPLPTRGRRGAW
jgi:hypothetical protein